MRKAKEKQYYREPEKAQAAYLAKLREDEDSEKYRSPPKVTYPDWAHCNQELRNKIIAEFEQTVFEKFGAFPKPNWMY